MRLDPETGKTVAYDPPAAEEIEYFLIYFGARWCGPCRKMTPALAGFYNETRAEHPEFEFVFVSKDRSEEEMVRYMQSEAMPWPAIAWEQRDAIEKIVELEPRGGIPFMAMLGSDGSLYGASDLGGFKVGIPKLINGLQERLGTEVYDVRERHGRRSPLIPVLYTVGGVFLVVAVLRHWRRRQRHGRAEA